MDLVQNLDYAQTFLDICGAKQPVDMQGKSLLPLLKEKPLRIGENRSTITITNSQAIIMSAGITAFATTATS